MNKQTKIQPIYIYEGLGFPIKLKNIEMIHINGEWTPKINANRIADEAYKLLKKKRNLNEKEIQFIHSYLENRYQNKYENILVIE